LNATARAKLTPKAERAVTLPGVASLTGTARCPAYSVDATRKLRAATKAASTVLGIVVRVLADAITAYSLAAWYGGAEVAASAAVGLVGLEVHARPVAAGLLGAATVPAAAAKLGGTIKIDADRLAQEDTSRRRVSRALTDRLDAIAHSSDGAEDALAGAALGACTAGLTARAAVVIVKTGVDARFAAGNLAGRANALADYALTAARTFGVAATAVWCRA
jgi:hypothetical protein